MFIEISPEKGWRYSRNNDKTINFVKARINILQIKCVHYVNDTYYIELGNYHWYCCEDNKEESDRVDNIIAKCTMLGLLAGSN